MGAFRLVAAAMLAASAAHSALAAGGELEMPEAEVTLLSGGAVGDGSYLAGLRIALPEGWKTYWRQPGDSGIPPSFDWSASSNVGAIAISWPAPSLFHDGYGYVIGYEDELVIPLKVTAAEAGEPVTLDLDLDYAVCKDICVPAETSLERTLGEDPAERAAIEQALASVPRAMEQGSPYGVVSSALEADADSPTLRVTARFPDNAEDPRLLIEGPADWYLPVPEEVASGDDGVRAYEVELPQDADPAGVTFRATGISSSFSFEQGFRLD